MNDCNTSQAGPVSVDADLEQLEEFLGKVEEEKLRLSEVERLLHLAERELGRETPSQEVLAGIFDKIKRLEDGLDSRLQPFVEDQLDYLQRESERLEEAQSRGEEQRLKDESERLFRKAERELARADIDQARKTLTEIGHLETSLTSGEVRESIAQRRKYLQKEHDWLKGRSLLEGKATEQLPRQVGRERPGQEHVVSAPILSLTQDKRVYVEITSPDGPVKQSDEAIFTVALHTPEQTSIAHGFTLMAWPAHKPYAPDIATVLGQAVRQAETSCVPEQVYADQASYSSGQPISQSAVSLESQDSSQVAAGAKLEERSGGEFRWRTQFQAKLAHVDLLPGHYQLALAYNDVPLPGRTEIQVMPSSEVAITQKSPREVGKFLRAWPAVLSFITVIALATMAWGLASLSKQFGSQTIVILTPTPQSQIAAITPVPVQQVTEFEAVFVSGSQTVSETHPLILTAIVTATDKKLPGVGYYFVVYPSGRMPISGDRAVIAAPYDQGERWVSIRGGMEYVDLAPGHYWVSVMLNNNYVLGTPLELEVQALPVDQIVTVGTLETRGTIHVDDRQLALAGRPVTFTVSLDSIVSRDVGGRLSLVEGNDVLVTFTEHLELYRGLQSLSGVVEFAEPGAHTELALVWQPEANETWHRIDARLPKIEVVSDVVAILSSDVGLLYSEPDDQSKTLAELESEDEVQVVGRLEDDSWLRVITKDGLVGWMSADVLEFDEGLLPSVSVDMQD
jgi:hypothetical protein